MNTAPITVNITDVPMLRIALRNAKTVCVQPRFGCDESWVKITKAEARSFISTLSDTATPKDLEMYSDVFGVITDNTLYLG